MKKCNWQNPAMAIMFLNWFVVFASIACKGSKFQFGMILFVKKLFRWSHDLTNCLFNFCLLNLLAGPSLKLMKLSDFGGTIWLCLCYLLFWSIGLGHFFLLFLLTLISWVWLIFDYSSCSLALMLFL